MTEVSPRSGAAPQYIRLRGLTLPGLANTHSHAFHRALRGRSVDQRGSFWSWRNQMYALASCLDPDSYFSLARAVYAEMAVAGITCVGEFHYLHHSAAGRHYDDPNAMAEALRAAAGEVGIRLTLLDACYLSGGIGEPLTGTQVRFGDGNPSGWAERVGMLYEDETMRVGSAIHSVRAVSAQDLSAVASAFPERPLHVHLSEQPAENEACRVAYGCTPTTLLARHGVINERTTAVHATHVDAEDIRVLGAGRARICLCPTTERDLADGFGPAGALAEAGCQLCVGTDQHVQIDIFEEARVVEMAERVRSGRRGWFTSQDLVNMSTKQGYAALGWPEGGIIAAGALCDLVSVRVDTARTAGAQTDQIPLVATGADVDMVVASGRVIAQRGEHKRLGDVAQLLVGAFDGMGEWFDRPPV